MAVLRALAVGAGAVAGFGYDGVVGAGLGGLACVGVMAIVEARVGGGRPGDHSPPSGNARDHATRAPSPREGGSPARDSVEVPGAEPDPTTLPADLDRRLAEVAHALRSPIAAATAAFAAFDERVGERPGDEESAFFRGVVQRNLEEARERLLQLEEHRLAYRPAAHTSPSAAPAAARAGRR